MIIQFFKRNLLTLVYVAVGGFISTYFFCPGCTESLSRYVIVGAFTSLIWGFCWIGNAELSHWIDSRISWVKEPGKRLAIGIVGAAVYTLGIVYLLLILFDWFFNFNAGDSMAMTLYLSMGITVVISLFMEGRTFLNNWRTLAIDTERLQKESVLAQYESLKNQVNPHFLFNSLNALTQLVYEDQDKAATFIKQLSEVYRYVLDTKDHELVSLDQELAFLNSYLFLQKIRFGEKLKVELDLAGISTMLPPLALQMLAENAIKHNIVSVEAPLEIRIYAEKEFLIVSNQIQSKPGMIEETSGVGLVNIRRRYEFLSDKKVEVVQTDKEFRVSLPFIHVDGVK